MNKKGFTVIELIATIIILSIIVLIATSSLIGVSKKIKQTNRNSLIKRIEIASLQYVEDFGKMNNFFVQDLITNGYLTADNNEGQVIDPTNNDILNCNVIYLDISNVDDIYVKFLEEKYLKDDACDNDKLDSLNNITIKVVTSDSTPIFNNGNVIWYGGNDISLQAQFKDNSITDCDKTDESDEYDVSCKFINSTLGYEKESVSEIKLENYQIINSEFNFIYKKEGTKYIGSKYIRLDNEAPTIKDIKIENEKIIVSATDNNGSGISGYSVTNTDTCDSVTYGKSNEIDNLESGTYKVCVRDNVGNVKISDPFEANFTLPTFKVKYDSNGGTGNMDDTTCIKNENCPLKTNTFTRSGYEFIGWTINKKDTYNTELEYENDANITASTITSDELTLYAVWKDNTKPTCTVTQSNSTWTNKDVTIKYSCSDNESGCEVSGVQSLVITSSKKYDETIKVKDNAGNETSCGKVNVYLDKEAPTCTFSGESTSWTSGSRNITATCNDSLSGCTKANAVFSYEVTKKTAVPSYTFTDNAGNSSTCSKTVNVYVDKTAPNCEVVRENTTCRSGNYTANVNCIDNDSGCETMNGYSGSSTELYSKTFSNTSTTGKIYIYDNVGNSRACTVSTMLDNSAPDIEVNDFYNDNDGTARVDFDVTDLGCSDEVHYRYKLASSKTATPTMSYKTGNGIATYLQIPYCDQNNYLIIEAYDEVGNETGPSSYGRIWEDCESDDDDDDDDNTQNEICNIIWQMTNNSRYYNNTTNATSREIYHSDNVDYAYQLVSKYSIDANYSAPYWWYGSSRLLYNVTTTYPSGYSHGTWTYYTTYCS